MTGQAKRKTFISLLLSLLIVTLFTFSLTAARYSEDKKADGQLTGDLEYVVADQIVVSSVDGLLAAIQNGYSNIQIADDVKNPIIVTGTAPDVNSDLTIDLNGHELQRNDRGPMLNVTQGVRLTIIDSAGGGGFYNPVGSVLNIDGGTLTVAAGVFESGPRDGENDGNAINGEIVHGTADNLRQSEYASFSGNQWSTRAGATISRSVAMDCYVRGTVTETNPTGYYDSEAVNLPVIIPGILERDTDTNGNQVPIHISGNMYFGTDSNPSEDWGSNDGDTTTNKPETVQIDEDTYLYFVMEGMGSDVIYTEGSADFYYTYYVRYNSETRKYEYDGLTETADALEVKIYGYNGVKSSAQTANHEGISGYSAVNLTDGNLYSRGGNYFSYFGETNTRCVSASGGYMEISNAGTTFEAHGDGVCLDVEYHSPAITEYLTVSNGHFYSRVGDTISVAGGTMSVSGGEFAKDATEVRQTTSPNPTATAPENGAAIHITGGRLDIDGTNLPNGAKVPFNISGSGVAGIWSTGAGSVTVSDATFTFNNYPYINETIPEGGDESSYGGSSYYHNTFGICAAGGTVTATDCKFYMYDRYARGIYTNTTSTGGGTTTTSGTVTLAGNTYISVQGSYSAGILAYGGTINVNGPLTCDVGIGGRTAQTLSSTAISTEGGNIVFDVGTDNDGKANIISIDTYGLGITSRQGSGNSSITLASGALNITSYYGTAIYMSGGTLSTAAGTTVVNITSAIDESKKWVTPPGSTGDPVGGIYNGVYIQGGNLTANGTFNVSHTGVANTGYANNDDSLTVRSFAVRVEGGAGTSVTIVSGNISSNVVFTTDWYDNRNETAGGGGGLFVSGGMVKLGVDGGDNRNLNISSNGTQTTDGTYGLGSNWNYYGNIRGGPAVQTEGGSLTIYSGNYEAQQGSGILVKNGNVEIYDGSFVGLDAKRLSNGDLIPGAAASYGFKMYGGTVTIWGGSFGSPYEEGSGAFVTWAASTTGDSPERSQAVANIYGGRFDVGGTTGFAVHRNALVTFDPGGPGVVGTNDDILVSGIWTGLTLELRTNGTNYTGDMRGSKVIINGGTFKGKGDATRTTVVNGVWIGESASTMTISGGIFQGYENSYAIDSSRTWNAVLAQDATAEYYRNGSWSVISNLNYNTNSQYSAGEEQTYRYYHVRVTSP